MTLMPTMSMQTQFLSPSSSHSGVIDDNVGGDSGGDANANASANANSQGGAADGSAFLLSLNADDCSSGENTFIEATGTQARNENENESESKRDKDREDCLADILSEYG